MRYILVSEYGRQAISIYNNLEEAEIGRKIMEQAMMMKYQILPFVGKKVGIGHDFNKGRS